MSHDIQNYKCSGMFCIVFMQKDEYNTLQIKGFKSLTGFFGQETAERWLKEREWLSMERDNHQGHGGKFNEDLWMKGSEFAMVLPEADISNL